MTEVIKTAALIGVTLLVSLLAYLTLPGDGQVKDKDLVGQPLFPGFKNVADAKTLEVTQFNDELGELRSFEVTQDSGGRWVIPSRDDYEADAEDRITDAATLLVDLEIINKVSEDLGDHATYGVVEPNKEKIRAGDEGIGKLIVMKDASQANLAQVVVGEPVADREGQRYVRDPRSNVVYVAKIDPDKVSTKFADWIEQAVLQVSSFDIETMRIRDYSVDAGRTSTGQLAVNFDQRLDMTVQWDDEASQWNLTSLREFRGGELRDTPLLPNEELNKEALDEMKTALGDLKIVDVQPKPKGLGADLKADEGFLKDREGIESLLQSGYFPVTLPDGTSELLSTDGEVMVATNDGVRCTLRFGRIASVERDGEDEGEVNRFVMITADVDPDHFQRPQVPELSDATENLAGETENPDVTEDADKSENVPDSDEAHDGEEALDSDTHGEENPRTDASTDDSPEDQEDKADERDAKLKEYQRQLDEYNEKIAKAKEKVRDLNYRFADWYYVVSEDVYKKIHLSRADVVVEEEAAKTEGTGIDSFRALEADGLKREESDSPPAP